MACHASSSSRCCSITQRYPNQAEGKDDRSPCELAVSRAVSPCILSGLSFWGGVRIS
jgi:hypothetical protein